MCGIFGYLGVLEGNEWREAHRLLTALALAHERRGTDASGYAALTSRGTLLWERRPGPARALFGGKGFAGLARRQVMMLIGHTRLATTGDPQCNDNNHPHVSPAEPSGNQAEWAAVHNGFLPGHREKAARLRLPLVSGCDSELLVQVLHRYGEGAGPDVCLSLGGKQSVLALHTKTRRMLAWTNGEMPLVAFRVQGWPALWWASTEGLAREALATMGLQAKLAAAQPDRVYRVEVVEGRVSVTGRQAQVARRRA